MRNNKRPYCGVPAGICPQQPPIHLKVGGRCAPMPSNYRQNSPTGAAIPPTHATTGRRRGRRSPGNPKGPTGTLSAGHPWGKGTTRYSPQRWTRGSVRFSIGLSITSPRNNRDIGGAAECIRYVLPPLSKYFEV